MGVFIDLNADLGEGDDHDAELLLIVSSCNIACGGHAGDASSMRTTVATAIKNGVAIGAHPSYPDRDGFGRRSRFRTDASLRSTLIEQIVSLRVVADENGATIAHVKPHGALYNDAATDRELADVIVAAVAEATPGVAVVGMPESELQYAAASAKLPFIAEGFVDRAYQDDGQLVPRAERGAVHCSVEQIAAQALSLAMQKTVETQNGTLIDVAADTLCVHGDTPGAAEIASRVRTALEQQGVGIRAIRR